jgi:cysteine desulfurase / selenocysteine lyase
MNYKKEFPILKQKIHGKELVYLDSAASSQKPRVVIEAIKNYYEHTNANVHRGVYKLSEEATIAYEDAHEIVRDFINARKTNEGEIIFTAGTTASINTVAYSFCLQNIKKGDEILVSEMEHHSNLVPWQQLANMKGAKLKVVKMNKYFEIDLEDLKKQTTNKTKIAALNHISNSLGSINDIKAATEILHDKNALSCIDAAQSVPHMPLTVQKINCDFLAFSGHKMCGPTGIGVLFGKEELLKKMNPFMFGGGMINSVSFKKTTWADSPEKFEAGTPNIAGAVGLAAAVTFLKKVGMQDLSQHEHTLTKYALEKLQTIPEVEVYGKKDMENRAGVISFNIKNIHAHDVASVLDTEGIAVRAGHHCTQPLMELLKTKATARASFYMYNTKKDVDKLVEAIEKVKKVFA